MRYREDQPEESEESQFLYGYLKEGTNSPKLLELDIENCAYNEGDYIRTLQAYIDTWVDLDEGKATPLRRLKIEYTIYQINQLNQQRSDRISKID